MQVFQICSIDFDWSPSFCDGMKEWMTEMATPRCTSIPMFVSNTFAVDEPSKIISSISFVQVLNLLSGRIIKSWQKLINQPKMAFFSSNKALD